MLVCLYQSKDHNKLSFGIYRDVFRIYDVFFPAPTLTIYPSFNNDAKATSIVDMLISGNFSDIIFLKVYVEWYRIVHEFVLVWITCDSALAQHALRSLCRQQ